MKRTYASAIALGTWLALLQPVAAELPSFLRSENSRVNEGNEQLGKGDAKSALESYNRASHELPDASGVQLDRGLALLKQGDLPKAREALLSATQPSAPTEVRADAYEDLSLAFYREADSLAGQNNHKDAQKAFRESVDAAKRSL
ncbi:MAG TPA: tetratricopeptide repeat protein, partial [Polyangiales bacterium]|nr:tetratricopeptide repeat protein [Polyangiales bacterium]